MGKIIKLFGKTIFEFGEAEIKNDTVKASKNEADKQGWGNDYRISPTAYSEGYGGMYNPLYVSPFNGEKNLGEMGPMRKYIIDHNGLRLRSWQLFLESEICQTVFKRFAIWVIGSGLKLQAEPQKEVLSLEGIDLETEDFNKSVESRFKVYANSALLSDAASSKNLHDQAHDAFINAIVGGDCLVVLRYVDNEVKVQLIDGAHVSSPLDLTFIGGDYKADNGNIVRHGVELDDNLQPVAFYVRKQSLSLTYERIPARGEKSGALVAFMVYGLRYRLDNIRGIPLITAVMETAKKMERYKEATIGSAEERQKIPYFIEHGINSTGENPMLKQLSKVTGFGNNNDVPMDINGNKLADTVAATTNKMTFNMPNDSKIVALESKNELQFKDFYTVNIDIVCATVGIPPNVAMAKYDSNFSASRAALKDWEHSLNVSRKKFADQFYKNIYNLWLSTQILANKINAPGYLEAVVKNNTMALEAYTYCRWVGANVPHIDPVKEATAERLKLGKLGAHLPLTTLEAATEALNGGDALTNMQQFAKEVDEADELGLEDIENEVPDNEKIENEDI